MPEKKMSFGLTGIFIGIGCLIVILLIDQFGPSSYTTSGSVGFVDGKYYSEINEQLLPRIIRLAFYLCFSVLFLGLGSILRKERLLVSLGAISYGLVPIFLMTIGTLITAILFFGITFPLMAVGVYRSAKKT